jgi:hypothetical protein
VELIYYDVIIFLFPLSVVLWKYISDFFLIFPPKKRERMEAAHAQAMVELSRSLKYTSSLVKHVATEIDKYARSARDRNVTLLIDPDWANQKVSDIQKMAGDILAVIPRDRQPSSSSSAPAMAVAAEVEIGLKIGAIADGSSPIRKQRPMPVCPMAPQRESRRMHALSSSGEESSEDKPRPTMKRKRGSLLLDPSSDEGSSSSDEDSDGSSPGDMY